MNENQARQDNLVETTDCLEAIGAFKGWKNFLFIVALSCLVLLQISFWLVETGYVKTNNDTKTGTPVVVTNESGQIKNAAAKVAQDQNEPNQAVVSETQKSRSLFDIKFEQLAWLIRFLNFVLILTAALYCLTMVFCLKVSMLGRLGGINYISRAFFLSLAFLVFVLPWQKFFEGVVIGATYSPEELLKCCAARSRGIFGHILHYARFSGYWLLVFLLLIFSQLRSIRWARATLRRLEVI